MVETVTAKTIEDSEVISSEDTAESHVYATAKNQIADIISQFEPRIEKDIPFDTNFTYFFQKLLELSKEPKVKEMLIEVVVDTYWKLGDFSNIVSVLINHGDLNMPKFQNFRYIGGLVEAAQKNNDQSQEYRIVNQVADLIRENKINQTLFKFGNEVGTDPEDYKFKYGWETRELALLEKQSLTILKILREKPQATIHEEKDVYLMLSILNTGWMAKELFHHEKRSVIAQDIFTAYYKMLERSGAVGKTTVLIAKKWGVTVQVTSPDNSVKIKRNRLLPAFSR